ncbi:MAG TPA: DNA starvation/stationary phase protection protein [Bryobacteraceae bacterium]|nr:DNA starvation/stationary phase protection protein [Bryobacteraceae bacterium]
MPVDKATLEREITQSNKPGDPVVEHLQEEVSNAFVLHANYKHYHWQTFGPLFRDLHKLFDKFAGEVLATTDEIAERIRMIGQDPPVGLKGFQDRAKVQPTSGAKSMRQMVEEANANAMLVIKNMREAIHVADEHNDPGTADVLTKFVQIHERHEWFLREILKKGDGLAS